MIDEKLCDEALRRFAGTADGTLVYLKLQKVLMGIPNDSEGGALRENFGRRKFAAELMAVMAEGMVDPIDARSADAKRKLAGGERPVVFQLRQPVRLQSARSRGTRRRIADWPATAADAAGPGATE